jgi:hypothetical protein
MNNEVNNVNTNPEVEVEQDIDLEIIELEDKVAPRNWNVYAML